MCAEGFEYEVQIASTDTKGILALAACGGYLWCSRLSEQSGLYEVRISIADHARDMLRQLGVSGVSYAVEIDSVLDIASAILRTSQGELAGCIPVINRAATILFLEAEYGRGRLQRPVATPEVTRGS